MQAYRKRDAQYEIDMQDVNSTSFQLDTSNVIRVKIGQDGFTPLLDLVSTSPSANGSSVTKNATTGNPFVLRLDKDDLVFAPGNYDVEIIVMDSSAGAVLTTMKKGILVLLATQAGAIST